MKWPQRFTCSGSSPRPQSGDIQVSSNYVSGCVKNSFVHHLLAVCKGWNTLARHIALQYWSTAHFWMSVIGSYKFHPYSSRLDEPYFKKKLRITCHPQPVSLLYLPWDRKWKLPILIILFRSVLTLEELCSRNIHFTISKYSPWHRVSKWKAPPTIKHTLPKMNPWGMRPESNFTYYFHNVL